MNSYLVLGFKPTTTLIEASRRIKALPTSDTTLSSYYYEAEYLSKGSGKAGFAVFYSSPNYQEHILHVFTDQKVQKKELPATYSEALQKEPNYSRIRFLKYRRREFELQVRKLGYLTYRYLVLRDLFSQNLPGVLTDLVGDLLD